MVLGLILDKRDCAMKSPGLAFTGLSLLVFSAAACTTATATPTRLEKVAPTAAILPTAIPEATPAPTAAILPTATPEATAAPTPAPRPTVEPTPDELVPLNATGPWLVGVGDEGLIAFNPDGTGRTRLFASEFATVPEDWQIGIVDWWDYSISDSGWVAATVPGDEGSNPEPRLILARLPSTEPVREVPILAAEVEAQLQEDMVGLWADIHLALSEEIQSLSWSPDDRYLAFAAAVEGLSADLYAYDTTLDQVIRLTDGPNQPDFLGWSPDSRWVIHREIRGLQYQEGGIGYEILGTWAAAVDGSGVRSIPGVSGRFGIMGWVSPTRFVAFYSPGHPYLDPWQFEVIDFDRGPVAPLYEGYFHDLALHAESGTLAIVVPADPGRMEAPLPAGLYLISAEGGDPQIVPLQEPLEDPNARDAYYAELNWSAPLGAFLLTTPSNKVFAVSPEGEVTPISDGECNLADVSPDGRWTVFVNCPDSDGLKIRDLVNGQVIEYAAERAYRVRWLPDSSGFYYFEGEYRASRLMMITVPDGSPELIHPDPGTLDAFFIVGWPAN